MKIKNLFVLLIVLSLTTSVIFGCGQKAASPKQPTGERILNIFSWADNFSPQVIADFEKKYNVKVNYDVYASNEELLAKIQAGGAQYDLVQPSDYMVATMIKLNLLEKLDKTKIPNLKNIVSTFQTPAFDPGSQYSIVYTWGITGIAYNTKYIKDKPSSWQDLWKPQYKNRLVLLNDSREILGMALRKNGFSNSSRNHGELEIAFKDLKKLVPNLLAFDTDTIKQKFIAEEAWIGTVWSGDAAFILKDNKNIAFTIPKEGTTVWADTLAIPKGAKHKELAQLFINYLLDPKVSVKNYEEIGYSNPNEKAYPLHSTEYRNNPIINLSKEQINKGEWLKDVGNTLEVYDRYWTELKTGK